MVEKKYSREYAIEKYINTIANIYGFISADIVSQLSGGYISKGEIIGYLKYLPLEKGFYLNDGKMYYTSGEIEDVEICEEEVVLHPHDPLSVIIRTLFPQEFTGFLIIKGDLVGTVKASQSKKGFKIQKYTSEEALKIFKRHLK